MSAPKPTKAARNELRKINATYNNNVAVGLTIAGYWAPAVAFTFGSYQMLHKLYGGGWSSLDRQEVYAIVAMVAVTATSLLSAQSFRYRAARNLQDYEE